MVAYGALASLLQILDTILNPTQQRILHNKTQLKSLHEKVSFLLDFLENTSFYGKSKESAFEMLETTIRDTSYKAEDIIESQIPNQLLAKPETGSFGESTVSNVVFAVYIIIFVLKRNLIHAGVEKVLLVCIKISMSVVHVMPFSVQSLVPLSFHNMIFVVTKILIPFMVYVFVSVLILSLIPDAVAHMVHPPIPKGISFATRYWISDSQPPEDQDLRRVIDDFNFILKEVIEIKDKCDAGQSPGYQSVTSTVSSSRRDSSGSGKNVVVGFDDDSRDISNRLISNSRKIEIVSIVGMGGIGKTTLARKVYDDISVVHYFDVRAWVTISQEYSLRHVLLGLLDSAKMLTENISEKSDELLSECLYKNLKGRRYLIVLDDIWESEIWDKVKRSFPEDSNGSCVVLTTRLSEVALYADSYSPLHRMRFLNEDQSWTLLCNKVFGEKYCPSELEAIGKEIARNCEGLPLAIAVIGGLLSKEARTTESWKSIADKLSSVVTKGDGQCMEKLSLSYNHLPHRLRACFLYIGVFLEDHEIPVQKLIRLWTAEGFLRPSKSKSSEEVAEAYLEDLIERNLILVCKRSPSGKIKTCNIHDLLRNLCLQNAKKESFLHVIKCYDDVQEEAKNPRILSIHPDIVGIHSEILCSIEIHESSARSVLCSGTRLIHRSHVYLQYRLLRVLDLIIVHFFHFPQEIIKLVHLRYLALTYNEALPPSISELWNLQTLVHHNWTYRQCPYLPKEILMMPKLRHLCVTPAYFPDIHARDLVENSVSLENLLTLSEIRNFKCGNDVLKRIPNLKQLVISYDLSPSERSAYQLEALVDLHELETLKLVIKNPPRTLEIVYPPKLAFPQKLNKLSLTGTGIPWETMMIVGELPHLEVLKLRRNACRGTKWEPVEEQFCQLKYLLLEEIDLVQWEVNETHFPRLQQLVVRSCYKLKEIPPSIGEIPTLRMIELVDCHSSAVTSVMQIKEEQESLENKDLKIQVDSRRLFKNKFYSRVLH